MKMKEINLENIKKNIENINIKKNIEKIKESYNPKDFESKWYKVWEDNNYFKADKELLKKYKEKKNEKFVIILPPPNITGCLHIGHSLTIAIQDCLVRYKRMKKILTIYIPGTDHAGIATQTVVEKMIYKNEKKNRKDFSRDEFLKKIFEWKELYGNMIQNQIRKIGASVDWSREYFTMSNELSNAVKEAFIIFFKNGLIYRDNRLVYWCPFLKTALSDIEVNMQEIQKPTKLKIPGFPHLVEVGILYKFFYQIKDSEEKIEIATTRIETMLGDVAVAVHPNDKRYQHLIGKELIHPFINDRKLKIIADSYVEMDFGTGAVKITPAHDRNDYEMMKRHNLECINIFTLDGHINENGGKLFEGMHRFECRFKIQEELKKLNLLSDKVSHTMSLPLCSRTNDIIEYMLIPQWYMNCSSLAEQAINVVKNNELKIIPNHHVNTWYYWLENIKDWCISRQLWWGHRIPAYKIIEKDKENDVDIKNEKWVVAKDYNEAYEQAKQIAETDFQLIQDEDVLDTWFSSALLPFTSLGWPNKTEDFDIFFPNTLLETGVDILFFWVARMVMTSLYLVKKIPFHTIYLHSMVRDSKGEKMSKSKGNVVDPIDIIEGITLEKLNQKLYEGNLDDKEINRAIELQKKEFPKGIEECGADALRFGLLTYLKQGRNINLDINRIIGYRHFCNKLWNAIKFFLKNIPNYYDNFNTILYKKELINILLWEDRWILHKLNIFIKKANENFESLNFSDVAFACYNFWLYELCDIYLELIKGRLNNNINNSYFEKREDNLNSICDNYNNWSDGDKAVKTLHACLDYGLKLLHPIAPFITEELYQYISCEPNKTKSISISNYPEYVDIWNNENINNEMNIFMDIVKHFRSFISNLEIPPKTKLNCFISCKNKEDEDFVKKVINKIKILAKLNTLDLINNNIDDLDDNLKVKIKKCLKDIVSNKFIIYVQSSEEYLTPLLKTMTNRKKKLETSLSSYNKKINDPNYETKVPLNVRQLYNEKIDELKSQILQISNILNEINECLKN